MIVGTYVIYGCCSVVMPLLYVLAVITQHVVVHDLAWTGRGGTE
jgi:hypothetical protein